MDLVVEFLVEVVLQLLLELFGGFFLELGLRGPARLARATATRWVVAAGVGVVFGVWWAQRLEEPGRTEYPSLLWASLAIAAAVAVYTLTRGHVVPEHNVLRDLVMPWRWDRDRLYGIVVINLGIAAGIALSFDRMPTPAG